MLIRGMRPLTLAQAALAGCRPLPACRHLFLCVADHYEPDWGQASATEQLARVEHWVQAYPPSVQGICDVRGRPPQHTFFCPIETYNPQWMQALTTLTSGGWGDIEVHLHHDQAQPEQLREQLLAAVECLHGRHGLLSRDPSGSLRYGFIHGNWALDNSHPEGRWCGVNNEISILRETGCYADFTMPAAPHAAQTRTINGIYYAIDDPLLPKSHDRGIAARVGRLPPPESLLLIQGPLVITNPLRGRLTIENGNLSGSQPAEQTRIANWLRASVTVRGRPEWHFIKVHTHGAPEKNSKMLLGDSMRRFHLGLRDTAQRLGFDYYYVTARELAQLVAQAEAGLTVPNFDTLSW